jgi:hypothetical protein
MKAWLGLALAVCGFAQDDAKWDALAGEIRRQGKPVEGDVQEYVRRVADRVAGGETWVVEVVADGMVVLWTPGHLFVPLRAFELARSESELAGLIAHALSHRIVQEPGVIPTVGEGFRIDEEMRADRLAVGRMAKAGYDPRALLEYVRRGVPAERARSLEAVAREIPAREWVEDTSEFRAMRARIVGPERVPKAPSLFGRKL